MIKQFLGVLIISISLPNFSQTENKPQPKTDQTKPTQTKPEQTKINQKDSKGRKQGQWQKNYEKSRQLQYQGVFKDDLPIGVFNYWYQSGKVKMVIKHEEATKVSRASMYYESGKIMSYGIYKSQLKDSIWSSYNERGLLSRTETFKNDKLNGQTIIYYTNLESRNLMISHKLNFVNDLKDGECLEYFDSNIVKVRAFYKQGVKHGLYIIHHPNGKPCSEERFKMGKKHGHQKAYDGNGKQTNTMYYRDGTLYKGKQLEALMKQLKEKNINPNE